MNENRRGAAGVRGGKAIWTQFYPECTGRDQCQSKSWRTTSAGKVKVIKKLDKIDKTPSFELILRRPKACSQADPWANDLQWYGRNSHKTSLP
jgi:hypothetical protein